MVIIVYSKGALDKYFSIFAQTKADMIVRSENISHPLYGQKLRKQNFFSSAFDRLWTIMVLIQEFCWAINFLSLRLSSLISLLIEFS